MKEKPKMETFMCLLPGIVIRTSDFLSSETEKFQTKEKKEKKSAIKLDMEQPREKQIPKRESNCSVVALVPEFPNFFDEFCVIHISMDTKTLE